MVPPGVNRPEGVPGSLCIDDLDPGTDRPPPLVLFLWPVLLPKESKGFRSSALLADSDAFGVVCW